MRIIFFFILTSFLSSCGELASDIETDQNLKRNQQNNVTGSSECQIRSEAINNILSEDISTDLDCISSNLLFFTDVVKSRTPGFLGLNDLKGFIEENSFISSKEDSEKVVQSLDALFEVNSLLFNDEKDKITKSNIERLMSILLEINTRMFKDSVYQFFDDASYDDKEKQQGESKVVISLDEQQRRRSLITSSVRRLSFFILKMTTFSHRKSLNLKDFFITFRNDDNKEMVDLIESFIFLKRVFLGGDKYILTTKEFKKFLEMAPDLFAVIYDLSSFDSIDPADYKLVYFESVLQTVQKLITSIHFDANSMEMAFSLDELLGGVLSIYPSFDSFLSYEQSMLKIKKIFLLTDRALFSGAEVHIFAKSFIEKYFEYAAFFYGSYDENKEILTRKLPIEFAINNYKSKYLSKQKNAEVSDLFNWVIRSFRFFRGTAISPLFNSDYQRPVAGIVEKAIISDLAKRLMTTYGVADRESKGGYRISQEQLLRFMLDFKKPLVESGFLFEKEIPSTTETMTLLMTLFQSGSNGNAAMELDELSEFLLSLISSIYLSSDMMDHASKLCPLSSTDTFETQCVRNNFKEIIEQVNSSGRSIKERFPLFHHALSSMKKTQISSLIKDYEYFSRTCVTYDSSPKDFENLTELIPYGSSDFFVLFMGMMAIEQTVIRFDKNTNNILEHEEIAKAFPIYRSAIEAIVPGETLDALAKKVFFLLLRDKKVPNFGNIAWSFLSTPKNVVADRETLSVILKTLSDYSEYESFDCSKLR